MPPKPAGAEHGDQRRPGAGRPPPTRRRDPHRAWRDSALRVHRRRDPCERRHLPGTHRPTHRRGTHPARHPRTRRRAPPGRPAPVRDGPTRRQHHRTGGDQPHPGSCPPGTRHHLSRARPSKGRSTRATWPRLARPGHHPRAAVRSGAPRPPRRGWGRDSDHLSRPPLDTLRLAPSLGDRTSARPVPGHLPASLASRRHRS
jgi:hypothetical protein